MVYPVGTNKLRYGICADCYSPKILRKVVGAGGADAIMDDVARHAREAAATDADAHDLVGEDQVIGH